MKVCITCKIEKEDIDFSKNRNQCKECRKAYKRKHRLDNIDRIKEKDKEYNKNNKDKISKKNKRHYENNKDKIINHHKEYRLSNLEKVKSNEKGYRRKKIDDMSDNDTKIYKEKTSIYQKEYYSNNKDKVRARTNEYTRQKRANDPAYKLRCNISRNVHLALKGNKGNKSILDYLPYSMEQLKESIESKFDSWMNWENHGNYNIKTWDDNDPATWTWHIDHIIPQSKLPYSSMEDENFKKCWSLENLRPLSAKQNVLEGNRR